jgi:hypothetical protein
MTTIAEMLQTEYEYVDGVETMTFTPAGGAAVATAKGHYGSKNQAEVALTAEIGLKGETALIVLWHSTLGGSTPKSPDQITDSGGAAWIVRAVETTRYGSTEINHRCLCSARVA